MLILFGNAGIDENAIVGKVSQPNKALSALDVQIVTIPENMKIRIAVPLEFITIEQTSGSLVNCRYTYIEGKGYALSRT